GLLLRLIAVFTLRGVWSFARRSLWLWFGCLRCMLGFHRCSLHGLSVYRLCSYRLRIFRSRFFWTRLDFFGWRFAGVLPSRLDWQWTLCGLRWLARYWASTNAVTSAVEFFVAFLIAVIAVLAGANDLFIGIFNQVAR